MPHEELREKNIRLVIENALDSFLENGIEKTKVADVARRSGLTERSVFRYFETKADLVLAASLLYWNRILALIEPSARPLRMAFAMGPPEVSNGSGGWFFISCSLPAACRVSSASSVKRMPLGSR